ncbi:Predicted metal-dependent hydrolase, TIM-barrel fold [Paracoccus isoporae]|uniref:Predicted metal-dependent hydrolase, TIM-barrel fold n=1 Tax=Paracoccus isoporae TaxID=591205 RepID=A0A1G6SQQ0_9RHOB|nr:amidohydrolase [Paracoccus isoporae]SDD18506.1 Predicted metal-dependent hydrolase, TIM-barrel fold [Paracoccus isoporae]
MTMIDTHLHLVDRTALTYPWLADAPALDRDWTHEDYAREAAACGITAALHMEVDVAEDLIAAETAHIESLPDRADVPIIGIIGGCRPESPRFAQQIEQALSGGAVVGLRRVLHTMPDDLSRTAQFRDNLRRLSDHDLPFDLCVLARQLPLAIALADAAPDTQFVLDHCGVPDIAGGAFDGWARDIAALAERPNVAAKISGLPAYAAPGWTPSDLRRWTDHVAASFGFDRLVWGSDWFVCTLGGGLTKWAEATRDLFAHASEAERHALYAANAARIWKLPLD